MNPMLTKVILSIFLTAVAYMIFPLAKLFLKPQRYRKEQAHRIALWNSIVVGGGFFFITQIYGGSAWNAAPAVLYYGINSVLLTEKPQIRKTGKQGHDLSLKDEPQTTRSIWVPEPTLLPSEKREDEDKDVLIGDCEDEAKNEEIAQTILEEEEMLSPLEMQSQNISEVAKVYHEPQPDNEEDACDEKVLSKATAELTLKNPTVQEKTIPVQKKEASIRKKYCSRCGSLVDNTTKACKGCGKQYFRGIRLTKISVTIMILLLVIVMLSVFCALQYVDTQNLISEKQENIIQLENEIDRLENQISTKTQSINRLEKEVEKLTNDLRNHEIIVNFVDNRVVFIENDNSNLYHKFDCYKFKGDSFFVFNSEYAEYKGYSPCSQCH